MPHSPLLLQLVLILGTARLLSLVLKRLGQPPVIGEMTAGIVLGPIVLGALFPEWHAHVFEPSSLPALDGLSQVGLVLFMFIVGAELRMPHGARRQLIDAAWISGMSVLVPMAFGLGAAALLYERFAPEGIAFPTFALFMASAMSITAFPIMARILKERGMTHSVIGRLSLTSAAMADVLAWVMLAMVVVLEDSRKDWGHFWTMLSGLSALSVAVLTVGRVLLARMVVRFAHDGRPEGPLLAVLLIGTFACAYATKSLGVHPVFGAFLFGAALPRDDRLLDALIERVEYVAIIVLMPVFFALAGPQHDTIGFRRHGPFGPADRALRRGGRQGTWGRRRRPDCGSPMAYSFRCRLADERTSADGTDRDEGGARRGRDRQRPFHDADGHGHPDDLHDRPAANAVRGKRRCSGAGGDRDRRAPLSQQLARMCNAEFVLPRRVALVQPPGLDQQFAFEVLDEIAAKRDVP